MRIKILAVEKKEVNEGKKQYVLLSVSYKNMDFNGKVEGKNLVSFSSPDVYNALKDAAMGAEFEITKGEKNDKGFVPWVKCSLPGKDTGDAATGEKPNGVPSSSLASKNTTPRSTYETPEERAKKQIYIVRQSSLSNAIAFLVPKKGAAVDEVVALAKHFEAYVFGALDPAKELTGNEHGFEDMPDDIPY